MIVWINGAFGAGKTTLTEQLAPQLAGSMVVDPEYIGYALARLVPPAPSGDFQDLPIWRSMTRHALTEVRRLYRRPVIVPMTLVNPQYLTEILGALRRSGEDLVHVWLDLPAATLRARIAAQVMDPDDAAADQRIRDWRLAQVDRCLAAKGQLPTGTHILDSGATPPPVLAQRVLALATPHSNS